METKTLDIPVLLPGGEECERCVTRLSQEIGRLKGVFKVHVDTSSTSLGIVYDPNILTVSRIELEATKIGAGLTARIEHVNFNLKGLACPDCAGSLQKSVQRLPGVLWAGANYASAQLYVEFERELVSVETIRHAVGAFGVRACALPPPASAFAEPQSEDTWWQAHGKTVLTTLTVFSLICGAVMTLTGNVAAGRLLYLFAIISGGWGTARSAVMSARVGQVDMSVLMTLAVFGAMSIGDFFEAATVVALNDIGEWLESRTMEGARRSIRELMDLTPRLARVLSAGVEREILALHVSIGQIVRVLPGEQITMDGEVIAGCSAINEAPITGESLPVEKAVGDALYAGTLNGSGSLDFRVSRAYSDTILARIIRNVEEAQAQKAPVQQFIDRFAAHYTPIVILIALLVAILPPLMGPIFGWSLPHDPWRFFFLRALSLLIIACPCAFIISTPVANISAIGAASHRGALIKGGVFLEALGNLKALFYDKTGTLTLGSFQLVKTISFKGFAIKDLLRIATALEIRSEHPLSGAFREASIDQLLPDIQEFKALPGFGVQGRLDGQLWILGNARLMKASGFTLDSTAAFMDEQEQHGRTTIMLANEYGIQGAFALSDTIRPEAKGMVDHLWKLGVKFQELLTGDNEKTARALSSSLGLSGYRANLLPEQKMERIKEAQKEYGVVGMVGDGVNDAPALAVANVGIVMGAVGSDTALETADIALMSDDLSRLGYLVLLGRRTRRVIRQNIAFSLASKAALLAAAVIVGIPLWLAVIGDVGVSVLVTLNAMRLRR